MVHIFSSHGPLVNQLKPARPIWAGFLHAFSTSKHQHDFSMQRMHQSRPSASASTLPRLSLKVFFLLPTSLLTTLNCQSSHQSYVPLYHGHWGWSSAHRGHSNPPSHDSISQMPHGKPDERLFCFVFFCSSGAQANGSARLFPSLDNEPQPWVRGTTSGDKEAVQSTACLFFNSLMRLPRGGQLAPRSAACCTLLPGISIFLCKLASTQVPQTGTAG